MPLAPVIKSFTEVIVYVYFKEQSIKLDLGGFSLFSSGSGLSQTTGWGIGHEAPGATSRFS